MNPRFLLIALLTCAFVIAEASPCAAADIKTESTYEAAQKRARDEKRLVFLIFKHRDCGTCQEFTQEVLDAAVFRDFASQRLAIVSYDLATLDQLSVAERAVFDKLRSAHAVEITPTIVIFNPEGKRLLRTEGYADTPAEKIVAQLRAMAG